MLHVAGKTNKVISYAHSDQLIPPSPSFHRKKDKTIVVGHFDSLPIVKIKKKSMNQQNILFFFFLPLPSQICREDKRREKKATASKTSWFFSIRNGVKEKKN